MVRTRLPNARSARSASKKKERKIPVGIRSRPAHFGMNVESFINFRVGSAGSQFCRVLEARSDAYRVSVSDKRQRNRENWPQPSGLRRKSGHTLFSPLTLEPPKPAGSA
jgi:hypothetical protein